MRCVKEERALFGYDDARSLLRLCGDLSISCKRRERERERSDAMTRRGEKKEDALFDDAGSRKRSTDDKTRPLLREETRAL